MDGDGKKTVPEILETVHVLIPKFPEPVEHLPEHRG